MDLLENICIPDSPTNSALPDIITQATTNTPDPKSPNSKRRLIIKKKSPSIQSLSSYLAEEEPEGIGKNITISMCNNN